MLPASITLAKMVDGNSVACAFQMPHTEPNAGTSLKPYALVLRENELEEVRWTGNSRWPRYSHLVGSKCSFEYEI
tara:strand:+ start:694 stop:918 length:225 start_codon:yes stop_codon:yes gene_type:complete